MKSYAKWSAAWTQWALQIPNASNPGQDSTGVFAANGQSGKVWFLAGNFNTDQQINRTITVPVGTPLFFPIINSFWVNVPEAGDNPWSPAQEAYARNYCDASIDSVTVKTLEIDGRSITNLDSFRFQSPVFQVVLPVDNIFDVPSPPLVNGPHPSVVDGYWVMIHPLSAGSHTIHFTGELTVWTPFSLDVTYHITVQPGLKGNIPLHP